MERKTFAVSSTISKVSYLVCTFNEEQAKQIVAEKCGFDYEDLYCNEFHLPENESVSVESLGF